MHYLETRYFASDAYLKAGDQPVLLTFGPQYFKRGEDWQALFDGLPAQPLLVTLDRHAVSGQAGSYPWPPMWAAPGAELPVNRLAGYLDGFYQQAAGYAYRVGGAFPGFHDIYAQAGVSDSHGSLDAQDGKTLRYTLQAALNQPLDMIQLITWNDYGEGTMIEPTLENGLRDLETVQEARRATDSGFVYAADDLRLPHAWYSLRVQNAGDAQITAQLDDAYAAAVAGDLPAVWEIITGLQ